MRYLKKTVDTTSFTRLDIPKDTAVITRDMEQIEIPYEELKDCRLETCDICDDMTAKLADISVGSTEWKEDWNTLIVRTKKGKKLIDAAQAAGIIEIQNLPDDRIALLKEAVKGKKERVRSLKIENKGKSPGGASA
jgi:coenzyme F420-reducing hydrogenase beta subunit